MSPPWILVIAPPAIVNDRKPEAVGRLGLVVRWLVIVSLAASKSIRGLPLVLSIRGLPLVLSIRRTSRP